MKFNELSSDSRSQAKITLGQLIVARANSGVDDFENLGRCIAAAFIAMERHDSAPEVKVDDNGENGRSGSGINL
ncbi:hypothetical protein VBK25_14980 [Enterobacter hormaechei]|jgi:hypothetical protein|uniref:hypothetical protein n=1 Tax=Enterobacter TaxID=547 RepID=UPI0013781616|nr:hypothetical protein [Escherichia coli]MEA3808610.1 hypothetical protein [Enterobacter hormaechei]MEA3817631.1 hypothetical protein [Enterobacter hormaechei]NBC80407.1 hypothetical protein [Enterobacter asburiae]